MLIESHPTLTAPTPAARAPASGINGGEALPAKHAEEDDWSFWDLLDLVNPLQHIPIVSTLYREITGDQIKAPMQIMGGFLFGGVVGLASGVINAIIEEGTGRDIGEHVLSAFEAAEPGSLPAASEDAATDAALPEGTVTVGAPILAAPSGGTVPGVAPTAALPDPDLALPSLPPVEIPLAMSRALAKYAAGRGRAPAGQVLDGHG